MESEEHAGKKYKPPANHPWRNAPKADVARWAKEKSEIAKANEFKIGRLRGEKGK